MPGNALSMETFWNHVREIEKSVNINGLIRLDESEEGIRNRDFTLRAEGGIDIVIQKAYPPIVDRLYAESPDGEAGDWLLGSLSRKIEFLKGPFDEANAFYLSDLQLVYDYHGEKYWVYSVGFYNILK